MARTPAMARKPAAGEKPRKATSGGGTDTRTAIVTLEPEIEAAVIAEGDPAALTGKGGLGPAEDDGKARVLVAATVLPRYRDRFVATVRAAVEDAAFPAGTENLEITSG